MGATFHTSHTGPLWGLARPADDKTPRTDQARQAFLHVNTSAPPWVVPPPKPGVGQAGPEGLYLCLLLLEPVEFTQPPARLLVSPCVSLIFLRQKNPFQAFVSGLDL